MTTSHDVQKTTYSISQDIASSSLDVGKLGKEIVAANCVTNFNGIISQGDQIDILCDGVTDQAALDKVVNTHIAVSLDDTRNAKWDSIDARTDAIIAAGFDFDGNHFSLSTEAQTNWMGLGVFQASLTWPFEVTTGANIGYLLTLDNLAAFLGAGIAVISKAVTTGRALKVQVANAQTIDDVNAVVDIR